MGGRNILFIMCDQLRFDYLGCTGHPSIRTPNIDALAARGIRFDKAYVQSPICGPSRMSFYTGRYVRSHGSSWNGVPLPVGTPTMGDHLEALGLRTAVCGKTHMTPDLAGMRRLGLDRSSVAGTRVAECGFEPWDRLEGLHPDGAAEPSHYNAFLRARGYDAPNPWHDWANAAEDADGTLLSGWLMAHADKPARAPAEVTETAYSTDRAMDFIEDAGDAPWCLHLSYIKPHWPYIAPSPYHAMYGPDDILPANRAGPEEDPHPILAAYRAHRFSKAFARDEVRERVIPAYMGLISQIDDEIGRLMAFLDARGLTEETLIVFTSDHGDYLGDHWLGEKELFHDASARIPLIVVDPASEADATRGQVSDALVEAIDLLPTFVDFAGGAPMPHVLEGRSLLPLVRGQDVPWRDVVLSEYDYSARRARVLLDQPIADCRLTMVFDGRWKLVHAQGFRPMLHDLASDPHELQDRAGDPACAAEVARLMAYLHDWALRPHARVTISDAEIAARAGGELRRGYVIGFWDEGELAAARAAGESGN